MKVIFLLFILLSSEGDAAISTKTTTTMRTTTRASLTTTLTQRSTPKTTTIRQTSSQSATRNSGVPPFTQQNLSCPTCETAATTTTTTQATETSAKTTVIQTTISNVPFTKQNSSKSANSTLGLAVGVSIGCVVVFTFLLIGVLLFRRHRRKTASNIAVGSLRRLRPRPSENNADNIYEIDPSSGAIGIHNHDGVSTSLGDYNRSQVASTHVDRNASNIGLPVDGHAHDSRPTGAPVNGAVHQNGAATSQESVVPLYSTVVKSRDPLMTIDVSTLTATEQQEAAPSHVSDAPVYSSVVKK